MHAGGIIVMKTIQHMLPSSILCLQTLLRVVGLD